MYIGIYPLNIISGKGSENGSFAWFIYSVVFDILASELEELIDLSAAINISSIPELGRTNGNISSANLLYDSTSLMSPDTPTLESILFCDPQMWMGSVDVIISDIGPGLQFNPVEGRPDVGNLDAIMARQIIGQGLRGLPWDPVIVQGTIGEPTNQKLSQLAAELLFLPPKGYDPTQTIVYEPQSLSSIGELLNAYTTVAGTSAYLDGSFGNHNVSTTVLFTMQRLAINWPQWFASLSIVLVIATSVITLTVHDSINGRELVPLTLTTVKTYLRKRHGELYA